MFATPDDPTRFLLESVRQQLQHLLGVGIRACSASGPEQWWIWDEHVRTRVLAYRHLTAQRITQLAALASPLLVVAEYVSPGVAEQLRAAGICYADEAGNAWLRWTEARILVLRQGFRQRSSPSAPVSVSLRPTQMRFVFHLLTGAGVSPYTPAALAAYTGVKEALVERFLHDLQQQGLWDATVPEQLLSPLAHAWAKEYAALLRNRLNPQRYRWVSAAAAADALRHMSLPADTWWSGEVAARRLLGPAAAPTNYTLYTSQIRPALAERLGLVPHSRGNVEILTSFFPDVAPATREQQCVAPLLVYADLLQQPNWHQLSQSFREQFLSPLGLRQK